MLHLMLAVALVAAPKPHRTKIAVLDVEQTGNQADRAKLLTQIIVGDLPKLASADVLGSSEIRQMLGFERQRQLLGCKEDSCLAELGGALGVDYLVTGQLGKLGSRFRFDLRLIDARKSKVVASQGEFVNGNDDALANAAEAMLRKLLEDGGLRDKSAKQPEQPVGGLSEAAPEEGPSHTAAWITAGGAVVVGAAAVLATAQAKSRFDQDHDCYARGGTDCANTYSPDTAAHIADALWVGTAALAGTSAYLFLSTPDGSGSGGEIGVRGSF